MNPEKLHDALNLLDEDLIAPVEKLRCHRGFRWQHLAGLAACLAVALVVGLFGYGLAQDAGSVESALGDDMVEELAPDAQIGDNQASQNETLPQTSMPGIDMADAEKYVILMETVLVEVVALEQDRLTATVLVSDRNFTQGDSVTVVLTKSTQLVVENAAYSVSADGGDFSEGASLVVHYTVGPEKNIIIAECISFGE